MDSISIDIAALVFILATLLFLAQLANALVF